MHRDKKLNPSLQNKNGQLKVNREKKIKSAHVSNETKIKRKYNDELGKKSNQLEKRIKLKDDVIEKMSAKLESENKSKID